ncbi:MAG: hypothetical protein HKP13_08740, partial [Gammaproteobacteria bacterium]|nr:hypothetical protein [Gammaproteobacteria bacterium]
MDKHSPTRVVGRIWPYALLLGSLALPATVISQTNNTTGNAEFTPPVQQPPMGYEARDYTGMAPAWGSQNNRVGAGTAPMPSPMGGGTMGEAMGRAMDGFMGQMQQQPSGYPQNYGPGGYGPYGASPFDSVTAPSQRPSAEYATGGSGYGSAPAPSAPSSPFDMGSTPFSSSQQGTPSDRRTMARRNAAMPPTMGQG